MTVIAVPRTYAAPAPDNPSMAEWMAVSCKSHRARDRLLMLLGEPDRQCYYISRLELSTDNKGIYILPVAAGRLALSVPGITRLNRERFRHLAKCWG